MKNPSNKKQSVTMKKTWLIERERMMQPRIDNQVIIKAKQSSKIKQHFIDHPEHKIALSKAQKNKWLKYKRALQYCENAGVDLSE